MIGNRVYENKKWIIDFRDRATFKYIMGISAKILCLIAALHQFVLVPMALASEKRACCDDGQKEAVSTSCHDSDGASSVDSADGDDSSTDESVESGSFTDSMTNPVTSCCSAHGNCPFCLPGHLVLPQASMGESSPHLIAQLEVTASRSHFSWYDPDAESPPPR